MADAQMDKMAECPVMVTLAIIGGKWKPRILWLLRDHPMRFSELRREIEVASEKMLSQHLRALEQDGIIARREFADGAVMAVEYRYTDYGRTLLPALDQLGSWGLHHARGAGGR